MNSVGRSLATSITLHAAIIALLLFLVRTTSSPPEIDLSNTIEVVLAALPPSPAPETPLPPPATHAETPAVATEASPAPPAAQAEAAPPEPEPAPPVATMVPPAPPVAQAEAPPPASKLLPKSPPKAGRPVQQAMAQPPSMSSQTAQIASLPDRALSAMSQAAAPQLASLPFPHPIPAPPTVAPSYQAMLSSWLESHKHYPEDARRRGEEGRAVLRFRLDRYGRVLDYSVVSSTGFADLDASLESMMRGTLLPPFPPSMPQPEIEVSVAIRFDLSR